MKEINQNVISHLMGNPNTCHAELDCSLRSSSRCSDRLTGVAFGSASCDVPHQILNRASLVQNDGACECGRSMVEMLGVLAIIGVISIGAIAGYTYGMNRYRTNEILDGANKRAYTISTQDSLGIPYNLSEYRDYNVTAGGVFTSDIQDWDGEFGLTITGVSKDVCENLIRMMGDKSTLRAITKTSDEKTDLVSGDCASPSNDLFLVYNKEMSAEDSTNSDRSGYCATHECTRNCNGIPCAVAGNDTTYDDAVTACGGEDNMISAEELGCTIQNTGIGGVIGRCLKAPSGYYWVSGNKLQDYNLSTTSRFFVNNTYLLPGSPNYSSQAHALCK